MFYSNDQSRRIAKEATLGSLTYGFDVLNFNKIIAITQEETIKSSDLLQNIDANRCLNEELKYE